RDVDPADRQPQRARLPEGAPPGKSRRTRLHPPPAMSPMPTRNPAVRLTRLALLCLPLAAAACTASAVQEIPSADTFTNPLLSSGPDPWVLQKDGVYYYMH